MKSIHKEQWWKFISIFLVTLVLTLPIYSSNAMAASLSVSRNEGSAGVDGYLDANADTWTLEVDIADFSSETGQENIDPKQVVLDVSGSEIEFNSCSGDSFGATCEFQSVLSSGLTEGSYPFTVKLYDLIVDPSDASISERGSELASDVDTIVADGSNPDISFNSLTQVDSDILLDFKVEDKPSGTCVGLQTIEILDSETGAVFDTISFAVEDQDCNYDYAADSGTAGKLQATLTGEGRRYFKIRATDILGHRQLSGEKRVNTDFVAPKIEPSSLELLDFGEYIGGFKQQSDVSVEIVECNNLIQSEISASSEYIEFNSQSPDTCISQDSVSCTWLCQWNDLDVTPNGNSISATITAVDNFGNSQTATVSQNFEVDSTSPTVHSFGSEFSFEDVNYVAAQDKANIYLYVSESGAGINEDNIRANLFAVGGNENDEPNYCNKDLTGKADYVCVWEINNVGGSSGSTSSSQIALTLFEDNVGNEGELQTAAIIRDGVAPQVQEIEMFGVSAAGQKNFFQSNDDLLIKTKVSEGSGLVFYINVQDVIMDALSKYQYGETDENGEYQADVEDQIDLEMDGWAKFTQDEVCERESESGLWDCEITIPSIKSGYDSGADLEIIVTDTAQNEAEEWPESDSESQNAKGREGEYEIEIFALDEETTPDFWEQTSNTANPSFINLDTVQLAPSRVDFDVDLSSSVGAYLTLAEMGSCTTQATGAPSISRSLIFGGNLASPNNDPQLDIIVEFEPFDETTIVETDELRGADEFDSQTYEYTCTVKLYSVVDDIAMAHFEEQEIVLPVKFAYSSVGALDESVEALISEHVNQAGFKILNVISKIANVLRYVQMIFVVFQTLTTIIRLYESITSSFDSVRGNGPGDATATSFCYATSVSGNALFNNLQRFNTIISVAYCSPTPSAQGTVGVWQTTVLEWWGAIKGDWALNLMQGGFVPDKIATPEGKSQYGLPANAGKKEIADLVSSLSNPTSLYDNLFVSAAGMCVPGIIYNLEKLQQVHCSKLACLKTEVSQGIATVADCDDRFRYGICKYVWGEVFEIPFIGLLDGLGEFLNSIVRDPFSVLMLAAEISCPANCPWSGTAKTVCNWVSGFKDVIQTTSAVANAVKSVPSIQFDQCKAAGIDVKSYKEVDTQESTTSSQVATTTGSTGGTQTVATESAQT